MRKVCFQHVGAARQGKEKEDADFFFIRSSFAPTMAREEMNVFARYGHWHSSGSPALDTLYFVVLVGVLIFVYITKR